MVTREQLLTNITTYINSQLNTLASNNPMINFIRPLITRAIDNNLYKFNSFLDLITDKEGNIDIESIMSEMITNTINTEPFIINTSFIGDVEIGGGLIKLNIPFINNKLVLNLQDLNVLKEMLITKS